MSKGSQKRKDSWRSRLLRSLFVTGMLPKLLIPIGFMPVALADGGPIAVCGDFGPAQIQPAASDSMSTGHADHGGDNMAAADHAGDHDDHAQHHEWERCSFAGAASAAPVVGAELVTELKPPVSEVVRPVARIAFRSARFSTFQSRAPPLTHS